MTVNITEFVPYIAPEVIGCPALLVKAKIVQATIEMCKRSEVWQYDHPDISMTALDTGFALVPPAGSLVVDILEMNWGDVPLLPKLVSFLKTKYHNWRTETGDPLYYVRTVPTTVTAVPAPSVDGTISLRVSLKPTSSITAVEDHLFNDHYETIAAGAKYYLMSMPNQKWSDGNMASYYLKLFNQGIAEAGVDVAQGGVKARIRVTPNV